MCKICKQHKLEIEMKPTLHLAHGLKLICKKCVSDYRSMQMKALRLTKKLTLMNSSTASARKVQHATLHRNRYLICEMMGLRRQFKQYDMNAEQLLDHKEVDASGRHKSISYELNLRVMLAAYHLGTGAADITKLFTMLGFSKMIYFERTFTRHEAYINDGIIDVTRNIIEQAMINEIHACAVK